MSANTPPTLRIGIFGSDNTTHTLRHGCSLWDAGYQACLEASDAIPVSLTQSSGQPWDELLAELQGIMIVGHDGADRLPPSETESLCRWCRENFFPVLAVDHGLHALNNSFNGTIYQDLGRELPEALQHRHPPESGLRHAINVEDNTRLATIYGEGEIIVNSEHRRGIQRIARGFRVCATALDGVVEAIESVDEDWFAVGVQWHPASTTASGLDIQLFRGLVNAAEQRFGMREETVRMAA